MRIRRLHIVTGEVEAAEVPEKDPFKIDPETYFMTPKSQWGEGPWADEPDRVEFKTKAGLAGLAVRNHQGAWCGYVGVEPSHPAHGRFYDDLDVTCHGGLTFADECSPPICHVPEPGEPEHLWWFGFDTNHCFDLAPASEAFMSAYARQPSALKELADALASAANIRNIYRTLEYVKNEVEGLAEQIVSLKPSDLKNPPTSKPTLESLYTRMEDLNDPVWGKK